MLNDLQAQGHAIGSIDAADLDLRGSPASGAGKRPPGWWWGLAPASNACPVFETPGGRFVPPSEAGHVSLPSCGGRMQALVDAMIRDHGFAFGRRGAFGSRHRLPAPRPARRGGGHPARSCSGSARAMRGPRKPAGGPGRDHGHRRGRSGADPSALRRHLPRGWRHPRRGPSSRTLRLCRSPACQGPVRRTS